jgi:Tfp pilus assembly protein PilV
MRAVKGQSGQVLLEVLVSVFLLGTGFISMARLCVSATWMVRQGHFKTVAVALATEKLEEILSKSYGEQRPGQTSDPLNPLGEDGQHDPDGKFFRMWIINPVEQGLKLLVVRVTWVGATAGQIETATLSGREREIVQP